MASSSHHCPAPGCTVDVPFEQLACRAHWYSIPKPLRDEVWAAYRNEGPGSERHTDAIEAAIDFLKKNAV